jgi:hypothetical protein
LVLGDGIRRNIAKVSLTERTLLKDVFVSLNMDSHYRYPGNRDDKPFTGGVTYWFKQDEIHQATHVHGGPAFLPWHRVLCYRFEKLLRERDKRLSLHYWDWSTDPSSTPDENGDPINLFTHDFMGNSDADEDDGYAGEPWLSANFYNPNPEDDNYRAIDPFDINHSNPFDPPIEIKRNKPASTLESYAKLHGQKFYSDSEIISSCTYPEFRTKLEHVHNLAHSYIGGTIGEPHTAFRDPFVFLLHSNVDRLFTAWQLKAGSEWRLDPRYVYGAETNSMTMGTGHHVSVGIQTLLSPWSGFDDPKVEPGLKDVRPWASPENWHKHPDLYSEEGPIKSIDISVVTPQKYDDMYDDEGQLVEIPVNLCGSTDESMGEE